MKKLIALVLSLTMLVAMTACSVPAEEEKEAAPDKTTEAPAEKEDAKESNGNIPVGVTFGDLANPVWADCANWMMDNGGDYGFDVNVVGCTTAEEQITQVENFLTNGTEAIVVGAKDTDSIGDYMKDVVDDTVVFGLGYEFENYTADMMVKNYEVGYSVAALAAEFINENFEDGKCQVMINEFPEMDILVDRVDGMEAALAELAPNAEVVAYVNGTTVAEVMPEAENALTANPDIKVCITIGDGGALGCKEAAMGANLAADDFGIFCVDFTEEVANVMNDGGIIRGAISLGGGAYHGQVILETLEKIFAGEEYEVNQAYPEFEVTVDNVEEMSETLGYTLN